LAASEDTPYERRHKDQRSAGNADQTEFDAIQSGKAVFEAGIYDDRVADSLDDFDPEITQLEPWQRQDLQYEGAAGHLLEQIEARQRLLGTFYPFHLTQNSLVHRPSTSLVYEFCLAIANAPSITRGAFAYLPRAFEIVAQRLAQLFVGFGAESFHTGWPRQSGGIGRFKAHMAALNKQTNEWAWGPEEGLPEDPEPANVKDEGIDFVVWKPHLDKRVGSMFFVGQCACGNDWPEKFHDTDLGKLNKWFNPMTLVPPMKIFCTPYHVADGLVREASREAGIVLDRVRLSLIAETYGMSAMAPQLSTLVERVKRGQ
jgi:hypothetical protein